MLQELKLNDVVVAEDLRVYYYKENSSNIIPLFSTSKDTNLIYTDKDYFNHLINYNINNNQFITDNLDLVLRHEPNFCKGYFPQHFTQDKDEVVQINNNGISFHNSKPLLFISSIPKDKSYNLFQKIIRIQRLIKVN